MNKIEYVILIDQSINKKTIEELKILKNKKFFAIDYASHLNLKQLSIEHELFDKHLKPEKINQIFEFIKSKKNWYKYIPNFKDFEICNNNFLSQMSYLEFHEYLFPKILVSMTIHEIINNINPSKIYISEKYSKFFNFDKEIIFISTSKIKETRGFSNDDIELKFNLLNKPQKIYLSKNTFKKFKKFVDNFFTIFFGYKINPNDKCLFLLEFNTIDYEPLIQKLSKSGFKIILFNKRRPAIFNYKGLRIIQKNKIKIFSQKSLLNKKLLADCNKIKQKIDNNLKVLWNENDFFQNYFKFDDFSFWEILKPHFFQIYQNRLDDYVEQIFVANHINSSIKIICMLSLSETGETEKSFLDLKFRKFKFYLLQHSFLRYDKKLYDLQWKYEDQNLIGLNSDNFLLWGKSDLEFFSNYVDSKKLILSGCPKYDFYQKNLHQQKFLNAKNVLLTLSPCTDRSGFCSISLKISYLEKLKQTIDLLQDYNFSTITVKLHPGENEFNLILLDFLKKLKNIQISVSDNMLDLINKSNLVINFSPEIWDSSTVILESLICNKFVIQIIFDKKFENYTNDLPFLRIFDIKNLEIYLRKFSHDLSHDSTLIQSKYNLENYIEKFGNSSSEILKIISLFR